MLYFLRIRFFWFVLPLTCALFPIGASAAQKKKGPTLVKSEQIFQVTRSDGKTLSCLDSSRGARPGTVKKKKGKTYFEPSDARYKAAINKVKNKKSKKGKARVAQLKRQLAEEKQLCSDGGSLTPHGETLTAQEAAHLYRRAGFGGTLTELQAAVANGLSPTLDRLFNPVQTPELDAEAIGLRDGDPEPQSPPDVIRDSGVRIIAYNYMLKSPNQLKEKMAFFYHDLFAASTRVLSNDKMHFALEYSNITRNNALGNFRTIAQSMTTNGMMLHWLDGRLNRKGQVNENYAREFWELFTLGKGNYTEKDIAESARAFTGWTTKWDDSSKRYEVTFVPSLVDTGAKTIFENTGFVQTGNFTAQDIVNVTLDAHPEAPRHLARGIFQFLVGTDPSEQHLRALAKQLKDGNYETAPVIRKILRSKAFFSAAAQKAKVKTPIEYTLGFLRVTNLPYPLNKVDDRIEEMGLLLYAPPSVKGWNDNEYWLNNQWLIARTNLAHAVLNHSSSEDDNCSVRFLLPSDTATSLQFLQAVEGRFDVQLTAEEEQNVDRYLNYIRLWNDEEEPWLFDPRHEDNFETKGRGLLFLVAQHDSYQMN